MYSATEYIGIVLSETSSGHASAVVGRSQHASMPTPADSPMQAWASVRWGMLINHSYNSSAVQSISDARVELSSNLAYQAAHRNCTFLPIIWYSMIATQVPCIQQESYRILPTDSSPLLCGRLCAFPTALSPAAHGISMAIIGRQKCQELRRSTLNTPYITSLPGPPQATGALATSASS